MTDRLTREDIVDAAVGLLADGGLHALAMRRIAGELGIQQSALYWHFENKQQLLGAVADRLVGSIGRREEPADWSAGVEALAMQLRGALLRYPDGAELVSTAFAFRLGGQRILPQFVDELHQGLTPEDAETAASVLLHFVLGYATVEQQHRQAAALGAIEPDVDGAESIRASQDRFVSGLRLILSGAEERVRLTHAHRTRMGS
jgi:TetR/AcrR family transcriptional regulator, tetracycline repressor protein